MAGEGGTVGEAVHEILGSRADGVDTTIIEYVVNVLQDDTFDFGDNGEEAFEAVGPVLIDSRCMQSEAEAREFCSQLASRFSSRSSKASKEGFRKLASSVRMSDGMDAGDGRGGYGMSEEGKVQVAAPQISERDLAKLERKRQKEERQRKMEYEAHVAAANQALAGMPAITVNHGGQGDGAPRDLRLENFTITVGGKELISEASVTLAFGRRYGLVGRNGTGKTTLLKHLAMHAVDGIPRSCQILHVEQEVAGDDQSVLECVLSADVERTQLIAEEAQLLSVQKDGTSSSGVADGSSMASTKAKGPQSSGGEQVADAGEKGTARLAAIYKRLQEIDAYSAEARGSTILAGLSFTAEMIRQSTKTFSGGWRMRVALARALFIEPDLLLLDEPTNHLDLHAVLWLESYLLKWPKTLIVVSHARGFLNTVCTDILHLQNQKLTSYKGDYDTFERTRDERLRNQQKAHEANEEKRKHVQAFIDKFRYNAKRASLVQSRIKALERMAKVDAVTFDPDYVFQFPSPDDKPQAPIISFNDASFAYPGGQVLFKNLNFGIDLDSRLAMVGPNGIGKSTLLKLISGELEPISGTVFRSAKVRMAVFNQHHVDGLDLSLSPLAYLMRCFPGTQEQRLRGHLGSFGLSGPLALQAMYTLSGGQKSRVAFAKITFHKPHILLMDEPSNHLDLEAVEALIQGISLFEGGVLMVSHDEHLISGSVDELWVVKDGKATPFHGSFADYKKTLRPS